MKHLKHHLAHLLMCAPMLVIAGIAIASGAGFGVLIFPIMCVAMMWMMMNGMSHGDAPHDHDGRESK